MGISISFASIDIMETLRYSIGVMPQMAVGIITTLKFYFAAIVPVLPIGILLGVAKAVGPKPVKMLLGVYTWAWRGTPLLLQLMIASFGLPILGISLSSFWLFWVVSCAFFLNMGAYITEIVRAAVQSVDKGQYEACAALSIPYRRAMIRIIIPQSIRIAIPPACSEAINLIKDIALISVIGLQDVTRIAMQVGSRDKTFAPYVIAFLTYLFLSSFLVKLFGLLEKKATSYD